MKKSLKIIIIIAVITCIISISGAYAATTYAISANKISYSDNYNLGVDNVQAALDGTCSKINSKLQQFTDSKNWKKLGESTGLGSSVSLSGINFNELFVIVPNRNNENFTFYIPKQVLIDGYNRHLNGGYWNAVNYFGSTVSATLDEVTLLSNYNEGHQAEINKMVVYYR